MGKFNERLLDCADAHEWVQEEDQQRETALSQLRHLERTLERWIERVKYYGEKLSLETFEETLKQVESIRRTLI